MRAGMSSSSSGPPLPVMRTSSSSSSSSDLGQPSSSSSDGFFPRKDGPTIYEERIILTEVHPYTPGDAPRPVLRETTIEIDEVVVVNGPIGDPAPAAVNTALDDIVLVTEVVRGILQVLGSLEIEHSEPIDSRALLLGDAHEVLTVSTGILGQVIAGAGEPERLRGLAVNAELRAAMNEVEQHRKSPRGKLGAAQFRGLQQILNAAAVKLPKLGS